MNNARLLSLLGLAAIMAKMARPSKRDVDLRDPSKKAEAARMEALIRREALAQGVPEPVALATAWIESGLDPYAEGDCKWHENEARFERVVPKGHPFRWNRRAWHSYGLFQLLAPYFVGPQESPDVLLDPEINATRGIRHLAKLLKRYKGDIEAVRLAYVGLATDSQTPEAHRVLSKWRTALARYGYDEPRV